jgi:hypothetical protein
LSCAAYQVPTPATTTVSNIQNEFRTAGCAHSGKPGGENSAGGRKGFELGRLLTEGIADPGEPFARTTEVEIMLAGLRIPAAAAANSASYSLLVCSLVSVARISFNRFIWRSAICRTWWFACPSGCSSRAKTLYALVISCRVAACPRPSSS